MKNVMKVLMVLSILFLIGLAYAAIVNKWDLQEVCTSWDTYTQKDFDNGKMCELGGCKKTSNNPWLETCTCNQNKETITKICLEKMEVKRWTGKMDKINKEIIEGNDNGSN